MSELEIQEVTGVIWTGDDGQTYKRVWDEENDCPKDIPVEK